MQSKCRRFIREALKTQNFLICNCKLLSPYYNFLCNACHYLWLLKMTRVFREKFYDILYLRFPVAYFARSYFLFPSSLEFFFFIIELNPYLGVHILFRNIVGLRVYCFYLVRHKIDDFSHQRPKFIKNFPFVCCDNLLLRSRKIVVSLAHTLNVVVLWFSYLLFYTHMFLTNMRNKRLIKTSCRVVKWKIFFYFSPSFLFSIRQSLHQNLFVFGFFFLR